MNKKDILKVACNIIGIFFLFQAVSQFKIFALFTAQLFMVDPLSDPIYGSEYNSVFVTLSSVFFDLAIAVMLLFREEWILSRLDLKSDDEMTLLPLTREVAIELTVIGVGIFVFAGAVPELLTNVVEYFALNKQDNEIVALFWRTNNRSGQTVFSVIEVIVSIVLVSNGRSIAKRLDRIGDINSRQISDDLQSQE